MGPSSCPSCSVLNCPDPLPLLMEIQGRRGSLEGGGEAHACFLLLLRRAGHASPRLLRNQGVGGERQAYPAPWGPARLLLLSGPRAVLTPRSCKGARSTVAKARLGSQMPGFSFHLGTHGARPQAGRSSSRISGPSCVLGTVIVPASRALRRLQ